MDTTSSIRVTGADDTAPSVPGVNVVPGASILGFGVNIATAGSLADVSQRIVCIDEKHGTEVTEGGVTYLLPANVSLIDIHKHSVKFSMFSSQSEYSEHMAAEAQVNVSAWGFSAEFNASYSSISEGSTSSYYGLVEADTTLWNLSVQQLQELSLDPAFKAELAALPPSYGPDTQHRFFDFFTKYGTHVVSTTSVGGFLRYSVAVSNASHLGKSTAAASMNFEYDAVFADSSGSARADWDRMDRSWISSRTAQLSAQGGNPGLLAGAVPPKDPNTPVNYNDMMKTWAESVLVTPGVSGQIVQPLSHVAPAGQVATLTDALNDYLNASVRGASRVKVNIAGGGVRAVENACTITIGIDDVVPPDPPRNKLSPMYWIVMADAVGRVCFNANKVSNDPDDLDALVAAAKLASVGKRWWTVLVSSATTHPPSETTLAWMSSCGVPSATWYGYPGWPDQVVAVGKSGSPSFPGRVKTIFWQDQKPGPVLEWEQILDAVLPLYVAAVD